ncbi:unnamed protein product [Protopolystoma xenopodis]|uniref:Uncharacterized protein n=1 Tax=Protopolystoma xenopodis TaxID=117903 RepID=A0A448XD78_9PLAT|nr:unnamed protein product [Protopolystoma xenopodis]
MKVDASGDHETLKKKAGKEPNRSPIGTPELTSDHRSLSNSLQNAPESRESGGKTNLGAAGRRSELAGQNAFYFDSALTPQCLGFGGMPARNSDWTTCQANQPICLKCHPSAGAAKVDAPATGSFSASSDQAKKGQFADKSAKLTPPRPPFLESGKLSEQSETNEKPEPEMTSKPVAFFVPLDSLDSAEFADLDSSLQTKRSISRVAGEKRNDPPFHRKTLGLVHPSTQLVTQLDLDNLAVRRSAFLASQQRRDAERRENRQHLRVIMNTDVGHDSSSTVGSTSSIRTSKRSSTSQKVADASTPSGACGPTKAKSTASCIAKNGKVAGLRGRGEISSSIGANLSDSKPVGQTANGPALPSGCPSGLQSSTAGYSLLGRGEANRRSRREGEKQRREAIFQIPILSFPLRIFLPIDYSPLHSNCLLFVSTFFLCLFRISPINRLQCAPTSSHQRHPRPQAYLKRKTAIGWPAAAATTTTGAPAASETAFRSFSSFPTGLAYSASSERRASISKDEIGGG